MNYRMFLGIIEREYTNKIASLILRLESPGFFGRGDSDYSALIETYRNVNRKA